MKIEFKASTLIAAAAAFAVGGGAVYLSARHQSPSLTFMAGGGGTTLSGIAHKATDPFAVDSEALCELGAAVAAGAQEAEPGLSITHTCERLGGEWVFVGHVTKVLENEKFATAAACAAKLQRRQEVALNEGMEFVGECS